MIKKGEKSFNGEFFKDFSYFATWDIRRKDDSEWTSLMEEFYYAVFLQEREIGCSERGIVCEEKGGLAEMFKNQCDIPD